MSVLHTTRGSGGVQAGRVEAEVEGATLVVEIYPQARCCMYSSKVSVCVVANAAPVQWARVAQVNTTYILQLWRLGGQVF
jgi:hypothetical protein